MKSIRNNPKKHTFRFIIQTNTLIMVILLLAATLTLSVCKSGPHRSKSNNSSAIDKPELKAAARTFSITPGIGQPTSGRTGAKIVEVIGDLENVIVLFEYGKTKLCFVTSPLSINGNDLNIACRALVAKELGMIPDQVVASCSHNHTIPIPFVSHPEAWGLPGDFPPEDQSNEIAREFLEELSRASAGLEKELVPVTIEWGVKQEDRLTYNRRGKRPDGSTYFIREEDRVELGENYKGLIDTDAMVVVLKGEKGKPVAALTLYTGHPVTGYNPEKMVAFGQWHQVACEKLSEQLGGVPVAFFQGCCGDINSKYMLTGTIDQARELGEFLGESFIEAAGDLHSSDYTGLHWERKKVNIPHDKLPDSLSLLSDIAKIDDFIRRGNAGDENTLECVGLNFPKALTPPYRAKLVELVSPWYAWALEQHREGKLHEIPKHLEFEIVIAQFGDVGYVGLPFEPFVKTGLKIKNEAPLPFVLTSGYTDGSYGYIPDSSAVNEREYMAGNYRYWEGRPPFCAPGADVVADVVVEVLDDFKKQ